MTGRGQCPVTHDVPRRCQKCRLERCLAVGMRKDFFISKEEKERRRERLESRHLVSQPTSTQPISNSESLSPIMDEIDQVSFAKYSMQLICSSIGLVTDGFREKK